MKPEIDSSKVKCEPGTGYEPPAARGAFRCGNCTFFRFTDSSCGQSTMVKVSRQPRTEGGRVAVDADGCCEYVARAAREKQQAFQDAARAREGQR